MSSHPVYSGVRVAQTLVFCLVFCRSVFFLLFFFFCWPFCCLSFFNLRLLITPSVYSNFSFSYLLPVQFLNTSFHICTSRLSWICGNPYYSWVIDALHSVIYVDIEGCADLVLYVDIEGCADLVLYVDIEGCADLVLYVDIEGCADLVFDRCNHPSVLHCVPVRKHDWSHYCIYCLQMSHRVTVLSVCRLALPFM